MTLFPLHYWRKTSRPLVAVALLAGVLLLLSSLVTLPSADDGNPASPRAADPAPREAALTVTVIRIEPVNMARTVTVNGAIHAWQEVIVASEIGGYRVDAVHVDVGDTVTKNQELVRLSSKLLAADVAARDAMVKQRQAELINADAALRRARSLMENNVLSEADLDRLQSEELAAQARLESARADLESASLRLQFTRVTAPDDGVITARTVTVGQIAQAGAELLRLMRQNRIEWRGEVPEARLGELHQGQHVTVRPAGGEELTGTIRVVAPTINPANRTGLVYVDIEGGSSALPGMFASGDIEISRDQAYTVPLSSIVSADGYNYVYVLRPDRTVERRRVETGKILQSSIELTKGVKTGELIVEKGAGFLKDGDLVNVVERS